MSEATEAPEVDAEATSTEIVAAKGPAEEFALAEAAFTPERREQVAAYFGLDVNLAALPAFFAFCARYELPAIAGGVWLIERKDKTYGVYAGKSAYLTIANRQSDFLGLQSDVRREKDEFSVSWEPHDSGEFLVPKIKHSYGADRGGVLGAWAIAWRRGRAPVFFYAPAAEYVQKYNDGNLKGAWNYLSSMATKAAESNVLRRVYDVHGAVPLDELRDADPNAAAGVRETPEGGHAQAIEKSLAEVLDEIWEADDVGSLGLELRGRLVAAVNRGNEADPGSWPPAKVQMVFAKRSPEEILAIVEEMERTYPPEADVVEDGPVEALRAQKEDLEERLIGSQSDEERAALGEELDAVEAKLSDLGAAEAQDA